MQSSEPRVKSAGRPSLLTPAQQAEADRNRILTKLEHGRADIGPGFHRRQRALAWGGTACAVLVVAGAAMLWRSDDTPAAAVAPAKLASRSVAQASAEAIAVPASAIITDDLQAMAPASTGGKESAVQPQGAAGSAPGNLHEALEEPDTDTILAPPKPAAKAPRPAVKAKPAPPRKRVVHKETDSDVALLSALMAHAEAPRKKKRAAAAHCAESKDSECARP